MSQAYILIIILFRIPQTESLLDNLHFPTAHSQQLDGGVSNSAIAKDFYKFVRLFLETVVSYTENIGCTILSILQQYLSAN